MKKIIIILFLVIASYANNIVKVVYDLTTGDVKTFEKKLLKGIVANKTYYENNFQELEVAVIIHGSSYKFFINDIKNSAFKNDKKFVKSYNELKKRVNSLAKIYDVKFYICKVGLQTRHIKEENVMKFVKMVQNASIGLIDKQNEGFAYLPIGD
ncbi:MAG: DsrE family protein [Sulfurimonas sp.]